MESSLFPLALTPIEVCWLLEDAPSHPMQFFLRLRLTGRVSRAGLERALQAALARHPLLSAVVRQRNRSRWDWVPGPKEPLEIRWLAGNPDEIPAAGRIDIFRERGLRVTVTEGDPTLQHSNTPTLQPYVITLQFQHTACDGLSASDFAGDLLTAYAGQLDGGETVFKYKKIDPASLPDRGNPGWSQKEKWRWRLHALGSLSRFRQFYKRRPVFMVNGKQPRRDEAPAHHPEGLFHHFSRAEAVAITRRARESGANLNAWILANVFSTFAAWRNRQQPSAAPLPARPPTTNDAFAGSPASDLRPPAPDLLFRVTVPLSLRGPSHRATPAANIVSLVCFDRPVAEALDRERLLSWLEEKFNRVRDQHQGLILPAALSLLRRWPGQLAAGMARKRFSGTTLVSNLGPVLTNCHLPRNSEGKISTAGFTLEEVEFLAVLRPGHAATLAASSYAGGLSLGMHYDSRLLPPGAAGELFQTFLDGLRGHSG